MRIVYFLLLLAIGLGGPGAMGAPECRSIFAPEKSLYTAFSKQEILDKLQSRGLNPRHLEIELEEGEGAVVTISYNGKRIAGAELETYDNRNHPGRIHINLSSVHEKYQGHGLGVLMYLILSRVAYKEGVILESSDLLSDKSRALWNRLEEKGWAQKTAPRFVEFKKSFLNDKTIQRDIDSLIQIFRARD